MDRKIESKKGIAQLFSKKKLPYWLGGLVVVFVAYLLLRSDLRTFRVNADTLTVSEVISGEFNDYIRVSGQVQPMTTIQVSPLESGVVHEIFLEEGAQVKAGDKILELKNENLDMQILNSEADLAEKENLLRNTLISMEQEKLSVHQEMLQLETDVKRNRRAYEAQKQLYQEELGLLDVVLGQSVSSGMKIGQINNLSSYKIEAQIDEHYIDRVMPGLEAQFERQDESYQAVIRKVYPEVRDGKFKADFKFDGTLPENIRTGQTYSLNLQLGQPEEAVMIPRGTFYQKTGGRWIYVVTEDGSKAYKREIRIGRQNPQYYEVLEGLEPGEEVITSGYDNLGDNDCLILKR